jgi:ABC-2 type transport system permease protein
MEAGRTGEGAVRADAVGEQAASAAVEGRIFDLGYQPYRGPREGRRRAVATLFWSGLRRVWGVGRPFRAKLAPWGLLALALIPALIGLGIAVLVGQVFSPFRYDNYYQHIARVILLFCTVAAPELLCPDRQQRVLSLYFSRALSRGDYVLARLAALLAAMLAVCLAPQALLYLGSTLAAPDTLGYVRHNLDVIPRVLGAALLVSLYFSATALAVAAYSPRRIYAAAAYFAVMVVSTLAVTSLHATLDTDLSRYLSLLALSEVPVIAAGRFFHAAPQGGLAAAVDLPLMLWLLVALADTAVALFVLVYRYTRVEA